MKREMLIKLSVSVCIVLMLVLYPLSSALGDDSTTGDDSFGTDYEGLQTEEDVNYTFLPMETTDEAKALACLFYTKYHIGGDLFTIDDFKGTIEALCISAYDGLPKQYEVVELEPRYSDEGAVYEFIFTDAVSIIVAIAPSDNVVRDWEHDPLDHIPTGEEYYEICRSLQCPPDTILRVEMKYIMKLNIEAIGVADFYTFSETFFNWSSEDELARGIWLSGLGS